MIRHGLCLLALLAAGLIAGRAGAINDSDPPEKLTLEMFAGVGVPEAGWGWDFSAAEPVRKMQVEAFAVAGIPVRTSAEGKALPWAQRVVLRGSQDLALKAGEYRLLVRTKRTFRLSVDDKPLLYYFVGRPGDSCPEAKAADPIAPPDGEPLCRTAPGHKQFLTNLKLDGKSHKFTVEILGGAPAPDIGEFAVVVARKGEIPRLLSSRDDLRYFPDIWNEYVRRNFGWLEQERLAARRAAETAETAFWQKRHHYARAWAAAQPPVAVPVNPAGYAAESPVDPFLNVKLAAANLKPVEPADELAFLRRVHLDVTGLLPTAAEIDAFTADTDPDKRRKLIDLLLDDPSRADNWVPYWQDVLAENPSILKPTLNNTGAYRFWILDSFRRNKPFDRMVTELIRMEGADKENGTAGFAVASNNDAPMAAKAHVLAKAFLAAEMKCARCHDAPNHDFTQKDLFSLAAMLDGKTAVLPEASTVRIEAGARPPAGITITLKAGTKIEPLWPLAKYADGKVPTDLMRGNSLRERVAAAFTRPENTRFAEVIVNRVWARLIGRGLVENVDDWEKDKPGHPELLTWLARELVTGNYDLRHVERIILNSAAYRRRVEPTADEKLVALFGAAPRRRLTAEQIVDNMYRAVGKGFDSEELNFDLGRTRNYLTLGRPERAWQFASLSNERDRPSLAMPVALSFVDLLEKFGWREVRPDPVTVREQSTTALQPLTLANSRAAHAVSRLCEDNLFTALSLEKSEPADVVRAAFLQLLSRPPTAAQTRTFTALLAPHWQTRKTGLAAPKSDRRPRPGVNWDKHLEEANNANRLEEEKQSRQVEPPTVRLTRPYREAVEDMLWALVNSPEFVFVP